MKKVFVTGANGEMGHALIPILSNKNYEIYASDVGRLDLQLENFISDYGQANILDKSTLHSFISGKEIEAVFHLAAILSTGAESNPERAHLVNTNGMVNLLEIINEKTRREKKQIKF